MGRLGFLFRAKEELKKLDAILARCEKTLSQSNLLLLSNGDDTPPAPGRPDLGFLSGLLQLARKRKAQVEMEGAELSKQEEELANIESEAEREALLGSWVEMRKDRFVFVTVGEEAEDAHHARKSLAKTVEELRDEEIHNNNNNNNNSNKDQENKMQFQSVVDILSRVNRSFADALSESEALGRRRRSTLVPLPPEKETLPRGCCSLEFGEFVVGKEEMSFLLFLRRRRTNGPGLFRRSAAGQHVGRDRC